MNWKNWIVVIIVGVLIGSLVYNYFNPKTETKVVYMNKLDTVVVTKIQSDTVYVNKYIDRFKIDTIYLADNSSNKVDTSQIYHYNDSVIDIDLQAKKLDWLKYNIHAKDTVTYYQTKIEYMYKRETYPRLYYGVGIGFGYGLFSKQADLFVGLNVGLEF